VDKAELQHWLNRDPIRMQRERLLARGLIDAEGLSAMERRVQQHIQDAVAFAQASPWPAPEALLDDVYA
jgi:pyruvate dehydrogenase E1 component alpha subunit